MNELKVGLLSLMALASIAIVSLKITSNKASFGEFIEYKTILEDATGIYENSSIKVAGIVAGKIKAVELSGSKALIRFEVLQDIKITKNSALRIKSIGFLGDKYIDIFLGDPKASRLPAGAMIGAEAGAGFEQLGKDASEILKDVKVIAKVIKESLYNEEQQNVVKAIVDNISVFSKNAQEISASLKRMINGNEGKLNSTIENLNKVASQLAFETDRYRDGSMMNDMDQIGPILEKVNLAAADLTDIMADVKAGKGSVGRLLRDEEVVDRVNETLAGLNQIVGRVNNFKTDISIFSGANNVKGSKSEVDFDLIPSPERFFRFGIVTGDGTRLVSESTTTTTVDDGDPVITNEKVTEDSSYRFNLQMGRKLGSWVLRAGLFESTGGLGIDYLIPSYGFTGKLEAYDYREDIGGNIKLTTQIRLWNVLHAKVSAEDLGRSPDYHVFTFSLGLNFTDEDLASLIGLAI